MIILNRKISLEDWKILILMYKDKDWKSKSYSTNEIILRLKISKRVVEYNLNKLQKDGYLEKVKTYPVFWKCIIDEQLRKQIQKQYETVLKDLLGEIE